MLLNADVVYNEVELEAAKNAILTAANTLLAVTHSRRPATITMITIQTDGQRARSVSIERDRHGFES